MDLSQPVATLLARGVRMPNPFSVEIGPEVDIGGISADNVTIFAGTRITGKATWIGDGAQLGQEGPVVLDNCCLGNNVELKGGSFTNSAFLDRVVIGPGAQVREDCLLEEEVKIGHTVGLKQTILFPFVTLGSLINFCDVFMAGGTSRKNHSEVGSSYIHFNFTPNQDKATPSLLGDVPHGVMLRENPLFLGGQGGLVGPVRLGFGTLIAAGEVWSGDFPEGGRLLRMDKTEGQVHHFHPGLYFDIGRRVVNNILYYANLMALYQWYLHARSLFSAGRQPLFQKAMDIIDGAAKERLTRFRGLAEKMEESIELGKTFLPTDIRQAVLERQREFSERWSELEYILTTSRGENAGMRNRDTFLADLLQSANNAGGDYLKTIAILDEKAVASGTGWLAEVVDDVFNRAITILPSFNRLST